MPLDVGRVTHLIDQMHRSEDDAGDPIDDGFLLAADGARGQRWVDPSTITGSTDAVDINVADAGGYFTGTNVETIFQELARKDLGYTAHGNTGPTETFDALTGWHSATLDADCTFTFTGATSGLVAAMVLELAQDGTGSRLVTWPGSVVWPGGSAPTLSTAASAVDVLTFFSRDGGTTWYGFPTGGSGSVSGGTPALTLSTTNSAGSAPTAILTDATIAVFDATVPVTQAYGDSAATGSAGVAARRDHVHGMPAASGTSATDANIWRPLLDGAGAVVTDATGQAVMAYGPA